MAQKKLFARWVFDGDELFESLMASLKWIFASK